MAADRQWAHSSTPKTNSCVQPAPLRWTEGDKSGRAGFPWSGFGWQREKSVESCRGNQNKSAEAKIALRERYTSCMEVSVSGVFIFPLTLGRDESIVYRLSCRGVRSENNALHSHAETPREQSNGLGQALCQARGERSKVIVICDTTLKGAAMKSAVIVEFQPSNESSGLRSALYSMPTWDSAVSEY